MRLKIGRTDVSDHWGDAISPLYAKVSLPIGHFELKPQGRIIKLIAKLDLWNAVLREEIVTDKGTFK